MLERAPLATEPSMERMEGAVGKLVNGKAVGTDHLCGELFKLDLTVSSAALRRFDNIVLRVWS